MKKAQVTIFILIGLMIIISLGFYIFYTRLERVTQSVELDSYTFIEEYVNSCIRNGLEEGLVALGLGGGYSGTDFDTVRYKTFGENKVAYYYIDGTLFVPELDDIRKKLDSMILSELRDCLQENVFSDYGIEIEYPNLEEDNVLVESSFNEDSTSVEVILPIEIRKGKSVSQIQSFFAETGIRFKKAYEIGRCYALQYAKNQTTSLSFRDDCSEKYNNDYNIRIIVFNNEYVLVNDYNPEQKFVYSFRYMLK